MIIITRHGTFLITNTKDFAEIEDEFTDFGINIRSASLEEIMNVMEDFIPETTWAVVEDDFDEDMPAFRFKVEVPPEDWVNLIARMGAGITYKSFKREVREVSEDANTLTLLSNLKVLTMQIYSRLVSPFNSKDWN